MQTIMRALVTLNIWKDARGQDFVEYALIGGFISVAVAAGFPPFASSITNVFSRVASVLNAA